MGVTSYPTDIDFVSTDINLVGGKNAEVGMVREDHKGRRFMLVVAGGTINIGTGIILAANAFAESSNATLPIWGANTIGAVLTVGQYFWMQTYGLALNALVSDGDVVDQDILTCGTNCVTGHAAVTTSTGQNYLGFAIGDDVSTVCKAFINPGSVGDTHAPAEE